MSTQRLEELLDAYGAREDRWPEDARAAARSLLERSPEARAALERAAHLDTLLDALPVEAASSDLTDRVLAGFDAPARSGAPTVRAPGRYRPGRRAGRVLAAAASLAAAAVALWMLRTPEPAPQVAWVNMRGLGRYAVPTDEWLDPLGVDLFDTLPTMGCDEDGLGCIDLPASGDSESRLDVTERKAV